MAPWLSPAAPKRVSGELRLSDGAETASSVAGAYCLITPDALLTRWYPANFLRWGNRIFTLKFPQLIELAMQIGKSLDLLGGHGGHHREAQAKRRNETFALGKSDLLATLIEDIFIEDRLELVGHRDKLLGSHPTFLSFIEEAWGVGWIFPEISRISRG